MSQYRTEQDLLGQGFSRESLDAIRSTTIITRNGAQHVVPESQSYLDEKTASQEAISENSPQLMALRSQFDQQQKLFSRHKQMSDSRIMQLEQHISKMTEQMKEMHNIVQTMRSNKSSQKTVVKENTQPETEAIDRNGVAPADVQVDKIFYCGER